MTGEFKMYDYDYETTKKPEDSENLRRYGQLTPPFYPLQNIKDIPIIVCGGTRDTLVDPKDYKSLAQLLEKNGSLVDLIECEFGHLSIVYPDYKVLK